MRVSSSRLISRASSPIGGRSRCGSNQRVVRRSSRQTPTAWGHRKCPLSLRRPAAGFSSSPNSTRELRCAGHFPASCQIAVLNGPLPGSAEEFVFHQLIPVLNEPGQIADWTEIARRSGGLPAMLHVDTGMARLGLSATEFGRLADQLSQQGATRWRALISHLACADQPAHPLNDLQLTRFASVREHFGGLPASLAASSGIFLGREFHLDFVRPGAALYGINPQPGAPNPMRQVVRLKGRILQVREVDRGEFGRLWRRARHGPSRTPSNSRGRLCRWLVSLAEPSRFGSPWWQASSPSRSSFNGSRRV